MANVYFRCRLAGRAPLIYFDDWTSVRFGLDGLRVPETNTELLRKLRTSKLAGDVYDESLPDPLLMAATVFDANARLAEKEAEIAALKAEITSAKSAPAGRRARGRPRRVMAPAEDPVLVPQEA